MILIGALRCLRLLLLFGLGEVGSVYEAVFGDAYISKEGVFFSFDG